MDVLLKSVLLISCVFWILTDSKEFVSVSVSFESKPRRRKKKKKKKKHCSEFDAPHELSGTAHCKHN